MPVMRVLGLFMVCGAVFVFASCAGGPDNMEAPSADSTQTQRNSYVDYEYPPDGFAMYRGNATKFTLHNSDTANYTNGLYAITIYSDAGLTQVVDSATNLTENGDGYVDWEPGSALGAGTKYWWTWSATFNSSGASVQISSGVRTFIIFNEKAVQPKSPRNGGHMDRNTASYPSFAVWSAWSAGEESVTYDFELYADSALDQLVAAESGVTQSDGKYIFWSPGASLGEGVTYYWRARPAVNGFALAWSAVSSFSVTNFCSVPGDIYAGFVNGYEQSKPCPELDFTDPAQALGPPNADGTTSPDDYYHGFVSLTSGGAIELEMGQTVVDGPGDDIRVYEFVSEEPLEVFAGQTETGPWISLGVIWCGVYCDFDLGKRGVAYTRFIRIEDRSSAAGRCYATAGSDIDSVIALNTAVDSSQCAGN